MDICNNLDYSSDPNAAESQSRLTRRGRKAATRRVPRLRIENKRREDQITLCIKGKRGRGTLVAMARLRSAAFLAISERPVELRLDLSEFGAPLDANGVETLVTIKNVASLMSVRLSVTATSANEDLWRKIGLTGLISGTAGAKSLPAHLWVQ